MTSQPVISKTWLTIALIAIGLFLVWVVFRKCAPDNNHSPDKSVVDSIVKATNEQHVIDSLYADEYRKANEALAKETVIQKQKIAVLEEQLNASGKKANKISYQVVKAKIDKDTSGYILNCDSLVSAVADLTGLVDHYQEETHRLIQEYDIQLAYKDTVIAIKDREIARDMNALNSVKSKYDLLYTDYSKVIKQNKRSRFLNRVLAGTVIVLGGVILAK